MNTLKKHPTVFISYSHDSPEHKESVRRLADHLIEKEAIDVIADFYEENIAYGDSLTGFMNNIDSYDRVLCIMSPVYKAKADEGMGGVGYEANILTYDLFQSSNKIKVLPIILWPENYSGIKDEFIPQFMLNSMGIFRFNYKSEEAFLEEISRAIHNQPKKPKPLLAKEPSFALSARMSEESTMPELDNFSHSPQEAGTLAKNVSYLISKDNEKEFLKLVTQLKKMVFSKIIQERTAWENISPSTESLPVMCNKFVEVISPLFIASFSALTSFTGKYSEQTGLLFDVLSIDAWLKNGYIVLTNLPEMLAYVYFHIYGAICIKNGRFDLAIAILKTKVPNTEGGYELLFRQKRIMGFVDSLGKNCLHAFNFLLNGYEQWPWIRLFFDNEVDFQLSLTEFSISINLVSFFEYCANQDLPVEGCNIPPGFFAAPSKIIEQAKRDLVKNSKFFKEQLRGAEPQEVLSHWTLWRKNMARYGESVYLGTPYEEKFLEYLLL